MVAPRGFEPRTRRLSTDCSTTELWGYFTFSIMTAFSTETTFLAALNAYGLHTVPPPTNCSHEFRHLVVPVAGHVNLLGDGGGNRTRHFMGENHVA